MRVSPFPFPSGATLIFIIVTLDCWPRPRTSGFSGEIFTNTRKHLAASFLGIAHLFASIHEVAKFHGKMRSARGWLRESAPATVQ